MQRAIAHGKQKAHAPGVGIKDEPVFWLMGCLMQLAANLTVPGIKAMVPCHLGMFSRNVLDKQFNKINRRKGSSDERIVFMSVVMEGHVIPIVRTKPGKGGNRPAKVAADIFDNRLRASEIGLCVNIKAIFVFTVYFWFCYFKRRTYAFLKFV